MSPVVIISIIIIIINNSVTAVTVNKWKCFVLTKRFGNRRKNLKPSTSKELPPVRCSKQASPWCPLRGCGGWDGGGDGEGGGGGRGGGVEGGGGVRSGRTERSESWPRDWGSGAFRSRSQGTRIWPELTSLYSCHSQFFWDKNLKEENRDGRRRSRGDSVDVDAASPEFITTFVVAFILLAPTGALIVIVCSYRSSYSDSVLLLYNVRKATILAFLPIYIVFLFENADW